MFSGVIILIVVFKKMLLLQRKPYDQGNKIIVLPFKSITL